MLRAHSSAPNETHVDPIICPKSLSKSGSRQKGCADCRAFDEIPSSYSASTFIVSHRRALPSPYIAAIAPLTAAINYVTGKIHPGGYTMRLHQTDLTSATRRLNLTGAVRRNQEG
jgi:hypothetical protein